MNGMVSLNGFGTDSDLGVKIRQYTDPTSLLSDRPKRNTIGVVTDSRITSFAFCSELPDERIEGCVWFKTNPEVGTAINIMRSNIVETYPTFCRQCINGYWTPVATWYYGASWRPIWNGVMYDAGSVFVSYEEVESNGSVGMGSQYIKFVTTVGKECFTFIRLGRVSLDGVKAIKAKFTVLDEVEGNHYGRVYLSQADDAEYNGVRKEAKSSVNLEAGESGIAVIDLTSSKFTGAYYVYVGITADSAYTKERSVAVSKIWAVI